MEYYQGPMKFCFLPPFFEFLPFLNLKFVSSVFLLRPSNSPHKHALSSKITLLLSRNVGELHALTYRILYFILLCLKLESSFSFGQGRQVTLGTRMVQVGVEVMPEPDAPELLASDCCLKPFPFQFSASNNRGINLGDILKSGKRFCGSVDRKGTPLVRNLGEYAKKKIGLAITRVSKCGKFGHWEFKKDNDTFKRIVLSGNSSYLCKFFSPEGHFNRFIKH